MSPSVGFIGLGNVGGKLAGSLLRNGFDLTVRDLDRSAARPLLDAGAAWADSPRDMAEMCDIVITCLPSPAATVIRRLEEQTGLDIRAPGFPPELLDGEPEQPGHEVTTTNH